MSHSAPIELNILPDESESPAFPEGAQESEARHAEQSVDEIPANSSEETASPETVPPLVPEIITSPASQEEPAESLSISDATKPEETPPDSGYGDSITGYGSTIGAGNYHVTGFSGRTC